MAKYKHKYILTYGKIRHYAYDIELNQNYERKENALKKGKRKTGQKSKKSINRVKDNLVLTIQSNITNYSKFITLTTKESCLNRDDFLQYFKIFKQNFKRIFGYSLKYVGVLERQKKRGIKENNIGSVHCHLVVFNPEKLDFHKLKRCWGYGSVDVKKIDSVANLGVYMAKYLTKDNLNEFNKKLILKSRNLKKPLVLYAKGELDLGALTGVVNELLVKNITYEKKYVVGFTSSKGLKIGICKMTEFTYTDYSTLFNKMQESKKKGKL